MRTFRPYPVALWSLFTLVAVDIAAADPVLVSLRPVASGVCACDLSNKVMKRFRMAPGSDFEGTRAVEARIAEFEAAGVNLEGADFSYAVLPNARFSGAILRDASFRAAKLQGSDFTRAVLTGADFTGAELADVDLETAQDLTQAQLQRACGNAGTRLPAGLTLPLCDGESEPLPEARNVEPAFEVEDKAD